VDQQREEQFMKHDFSGEYVLNREASTLSASGAASVESASLRIKHDEPNFSCQGTFSFANAKPVEWTFELVATDEPETQTEGATLHWDGGALVFASRSEAKTINFRYEFDAEKRLRLAEKLRGTAHDQDNLWIFDRR
jgi:hypothetical protein